VDPGFGEALEGGVGLISIVDRAGNHHRRGAVLQQVDFIDEIEVKCPGFFLFVESDWKLSYSSSMLQLIYPLWKILSSIF
jgi:hypothetical protein